MLRAGSMAPLAIDPFRQRSRVDGLRERLVMSLRDLRISVVTEHAIVAYWATEAVMVGTVVARIHRPVASFFRVPTERQLGQRTAGGPMQVRARMVAGSHDEVDLLFHHIHRFAREIHLVAALIVFAIAPEHGEITVRWLVVIGAFYHVHRRRQERKRSRHARLAVSFRYLAMAAGANPGRDIAGFFRRCSLGADGIRRVDRRNARKVYHQRRQSEEDARQPSMSPHCWFPYRLADGKWIS